jgi:hypothetical protein
MAAKDCEGHVQTSQNETRQDARKLKMIILPELHRGPELEFGPSVTVDVFAILPSDALYAKWVPQYLVIVSSTLVIELRDS